MADSTKFAMSPPETQSVLSQINTDIAKNPGQVLSPSPGGYYMALIGAIQAQRVALSARATSAAALNSASAQFSVSTVQAAEETNAAALTPRKGNIAWQRRLCGLGPHRQHQPG